MTTLIIVAALTCLAIVADFAFFRRNAKKNIEILTETIKDPIELSLRVSKEQTLRKFYSSSMFGLLFFVTYNIITGVTHNYDIGNTLIILASVLSLVDALINTLRLGSINKRLKNQA